MANITVGKGNGFSVNRSKPSMRDAGSSGGGVFMPRPMPDGSVVRELDRGVHEQALKAANRKLRSVLGKS